MTQEMSELESYLNCAVDLVPVPIASGRLLETWEVKSCEDGRVVLESDGRSGRVFELWLKPREVLQPIRQPPGRERPLWKLRNQLYYNGRKFVGSEDAE